MEDVRYYVMSSIRVNVPQVMEKNKGVGPLDSSATHVFIYSDVVLSVAYVLHCVFVLCRLCCLYIRTTCSLSCPTLMCQARSLK